MSFETFGDKPEQLSEEEAHQEANMMRGSMEDGNATPEDYDKALQMVEDLKALAEQDSTGTKVADKIVELSGKGGEAFLILASLMSPFTGGPEHVREIVNKNRDLSAELGSATEKLRRMKAKAKDFAKNEGQEAA